jgi:hypothetical protein
MGTYDTIGGHAASPDVDTSEGSPLVDAVRGILESWCGATNDPDMNDKVAELIETAELQQYETQRSLVSALQHAMRVLASPGVWEAARPHGGENVLAMMKSALKNAGVA